MNDDTLDMTGDWTRTFIALAREVEALRFGRFELKSGRISPYFFNAGRFSDGRSIEVLAGCYADAICASGVEFDMLFGPAYKGIPLATAVAVSLYQRHGRNCPVAYNRKEAKDHGEGGAMVGADIHGRVLVIDDVISAGTAFGEARQLVESAGGTIAALAVGLDRQERGTGTGSAGSELARRGIDVVAVARLADLVDDLRRNDSAGAELSAMLDYQQKFGVPIGS